MAPREDAGGRSDFQIALAMLFVGSRTACRSSTLAMDIWFNRIPIQPHAFVALTLRMGRVAPGLGVDRRSANITVRDIDEMRVRLRWRMIRHPSLHPRLKQLICLLLLYFGKRNAKVLLRLCIQPVQARLIHLLTLHR